MPIFTWLPAVSLPVSRRACLTSVTGATLSLLLSACTTRQVLPTPDADWETNTGQLLYRGAKERSVIGEVVVRHSGSSNFALNFLSGPGFPLLKLQVSGDDVIAEGVLARGRWHGKVQNAPQTLRGWIALREVFATIPAKPVNSGWTMDIRSSGKRVEHLDARYAPTGERFAFHFSS